jgi:NAD(P)H-hydrate epimerase
MATAGSGDVLAGLCGGVLSSGYSIQDAALLSVFVHGKAGDIAADLFSQEALTASMISENIGVAWKFID